MAEAFLDRTSKKLEKSLGKSRVVQSRAKRWDDVNKAAQESKSNAFEALRQVIDEGGEAKGGEWETDDEMDGDEGAEGAESAVPVLNNDDDDIL